VHFNSRHPSPARVIGSLYAATKPKYKNNKCGTRYENSSFQIKQNKIKIEKKKEKPLRTGNC
jgi:hypothetical protein